MPASAAPSAALDPAARALALRRATAETTDRAFRAEPTLESLVDILAALLTNADLLVNLLTEHPGLPLVACKEGCAFCCRRPVSASIGEIIVLYCYIRELFAPDEIAALRARLAAPTDSVCPLLDLQTGLCGAYAARPLACRATHSYSAPACEAESLHPDQGIRIPQRHEVLTALAGLQLGAIDGLTANRLIEGSVTLSAGLATFFADAGQILAFIDGKKISFR